MPAAEKIVEKSKHALDMPLILNGITNAWSLRIDLGTTERTRVILP